MTKRKHYSILLSAGFLLTIIFSLQLFLPFLGQAVPIKEVQARKIAESFFARYLQTQGLRSQTSKPSLLLESAPVRQISGVLRSSIASNSPYYYIYNRGRGEGFIIVAGDDAFSPIIGYSLKGTFSSQSMPSHLEAYLDACKRTIDYLTIRTSTKFQLTPTETAPLEKKSVEPLLKDIEWDQDFPWNDKTPIEGNEHTPVGCVATAYTQIMRFWQWPDKGNGSFTYTEANGTNRRHTANFGETTYDWANMPAYLLKDQKPTEAQKQALSTLSSHAGIAVEMMYSKGGSGAYGQNVVRALRENFRYDKGVTHLLRDNYTQEYWEGILRRELQEGRPVLYTGNSSGGGHAFVCDGYDEKGLFHINWGWRGISNGYFNLNYLLPPALGIGGGLGGGFSFNQGMIIGIKPDKEGKSTDSQHTPILKVEELGFSLIGGDHLVIPSASVYVSNQESYYPYNGDITYATTNINTTDTIYFDSFSKTFNINKVFYGLRRTDANLQIPDGKITEGIWDFFVVQKVNRGGEQVWTPCGGALHRAFSIKKNGSQYIVEDYDDSYSWVSLSLEANTFSASLFSYEKSSLKFTIKNDGKKEAFGKLFLQMKQSTDSQWGNYYQLLEAIPVKGKKSLEIPFDRFPFGEGTVDIRLQYTTERGALKYVNFPQQKVTRPSAIRPSFIISSTNFNGSQTTINLKSGKVSHPISLSYQGTEKPKNTVYYRYKLSKDSFSATGEWKQFDFSKNKIEETPSLTAELSKIYAQVGNRVLLSVEIWEYANGKYINRIPLVEDPYVDLFVVDSKPIEEGIIKLKTNRKAGEQVSFTIISDSGVAIDGVRESVAIVNSKGTYTLTGQDIVIRGRVSMLDCSDNALSSLDVSQVGLRILNCSNNDLTSLDLSQSIALTRVNATNNQLTSLKACTMGMLNELKCYGNHIRGKEMETLVNSLPKRQGETVGKLYIVGTIDSAIDNACLKSDVDIAKSRSWIVYRSNNEPYNGMDRPIDPKYFRVSIESSPFGTISIEGYSDLNVVPEGTKLTVKVQPKEGYEVEKILINNKQINSSSFVVSTDVMVKVIFKKKSFVVTLVKPIDGGTFIVKGYTEDALQNVPYGTDLVIEPSPAEGYELAALTANDIDIKDTKRVTIYRATTIKATFKKLNKPVPPEPKPQKKTFVVTLESVQNGTIEVLEKGINLAKVEEGSTLTIKAIPAEGYELATLTANDIDIKDTKKVTIQRATTIKATFKKKTSVDNIANSSISIYPNPAKEFVRVEGGNINSILSLYTMEGYLLFKTKIYSTEAISLNVSSYPKGQYILRIDDVSYRLIIL